MKFDDIPLFPRTCWEVDVELVDLPYFVAKHQATYGLDLDPEFQRGHVWLPEQKSAFVEYMLQGVEASRNLIFNCPGCGGSGELGPYVVVDGKQRLTACLEYLQNKVEAFGKTFSEMQGRPRVFIGFKWRVLALPDEASTLRYYLALNAGGTPHHPDELNRVRAMLTALEGGQ